MTDTPPSPIEIEIITIDNPAKLPKGSIRARTEKVDSTWRPSEGVWFKFVNLLNVINWFEELED